MLSPKELIAQAEALLHQAEAASAAPAAPAAAPVAPIAPAKASPVAPKGQPSVYETYMSVATRK